VGVAGFSIFQFNKTKGRNMNKEITLPVSELREALPGFSKIIGKSRTLPVLQSVKVSRDAGGKVSLQATDLDSVATYTVKDQQAGAPVEILVPLETLNKTVKGLNAEDTIGLVREDKERVRICYTIGGSAVAQSISTTPVEEFPPEPKITQPASPLEAGFGTALKQALQCCSEETSRPVINGACLDVRDKKFHYIIGTNGRCLFSANSFAFNLPKSVIIPDSKFLNWTDLMDDTACSLAVEPGEEAVPAKKGKLAKEAVPGWVKLESPRWQFITREILGEFPNWKQCVPTPTGKWTRILLSDAAIKQMLQVIPRLPGADSFNSPIRLRTDRCLHLDGRNKDQDGWTSIPVQDVTITGGPIVTCLNREYLLKALRFNLNQVEIEDALTPVVFSNTGKRLVVMPVRLEGDKPQVSAPVQPSPPPQQQTAEQPTPPADTEAQPEERTEMPRTSTTSASSTSRMPETTPQTHSAEHQNGNGNGSAVKSIVDHVEQIKENLKNVIRDLNTVVDSLKQAEKEKRSSEREVESIRTKLRQIQNVTI
jgi:DNA polymerase III sliding clamp (beta) subunit (PCNA family)